MAALIHNCVAKKYSLKGQKGKQSFCDLTMWNAVKGAILLKVDSNLSATEHAVQLWLRDAAYRKQEDGSPSKVRPKKSPQKC